MTIARTTAANLVRRVLDGSHAERPAPGPRGFILRSVLRGGHDFLGVVDGMARDYGDVASFSVGAALGGSRIWCLFHPDDVEAVVVGHYKDVVKDVSTHSLERVLGRGLLTSEGDLWLRQRKLIAPVFARNQVKGFSDQIVRTAVEHRDDPTRFPADGDAEGRESEIHRRMSELALEIVVRTVFGSARTPPFNAIGHLLDRATTAYGRRLASWEQLVPLDYPTPTVRAIDQCRAELDDIVYAMIEHHEPGDGTALLDRLLAARDDQGNSMTTQQVRDEAATLLVAGHETTALVLTYTAYLLAKHPGVQAQLHAELDEVLGDREPTVDDLPRLRLTDAIVRESMRLFPPAWSIGREVVTPFEVRGYRIPRGAQILMAPWVNHRDPRWFPEPLRFDPSRWLDDRVSRPRFAYFPFGGGPRICVGNHFALLEAVLVLGTLARRLHFRTTPHTRVELVPAVTLRPKGGVRLHVANRRGSFQSARNIVYDR